MLRQVYVRKCHVAVKQLLSDDWGRIQGRHETKAVGLAWHGVAKSLWGLFSLG